MCMYDLKSGFEEFLSSRWETENLEIGAEWVCFFSTFFLCEKEIRIATVIRSAYNHPLSSAGVPVLVFFNIRACIRALIFD